MKEILTAVAVLMALQGCASLVSVTQTPAGGGKVRYDVGLLGLSNEASGPLTILRTSDPEAVQVLPLFQFKKDDKRMENFKRVMKNVQEMNALMNTDTSSDEYAFVQQNAAILELIKESGRERARAGARRALKRAVATPLSP
jgi:uncharacterized protein YceK